MGTKLKGHLASSEILQQLMFSVVLLHWYVHCDGNGTRRHMDYTMWRSLTVEDASDAALDHVLRRIHGNVCKDFIPELEIAIAGRRGGREKVRSGPDEGGGRSLAEQSGDPEGTTQERQGPNLFSSAGVTGWACIVGGGFLRPSGRVGVQNVTYQHTTSIFSEITNATNRLQGPLSFHSEGGPRVHVTPSEREEASGFRGDGLAWLSVFHTILFFSISNRGSAPYAFLQMPQVCISSIKRENLIVTITGKPPSTDLTPRLAGSSPGQEASPGSSGPHSPPVATPCDSPGAEPQRTVPLTIVLLLPDGRWQELKLPQLELQLQSAAELDLWITHFSKNDEGAQSASDIWLEVM